MSLTAFIVDHRLFLIVPDHYLLRTTVEWKKKINKSPDSVTVAPSCFIRLWRAHSLCVRTLFYELWLRERVHNLFGRNSHFLIGTYSGNEVSPCIVVGLYLWNTYLSLLLSPISLSSNPPEKVSHDI